MWSKLFKVDEQMHRLRNPVLKTKVRGGISVEIDPPHRMKIVYRCLLSQIANNLYFHYLLYALPLTLMSVTSHLDFVRDTFAIVYIATLDDLLPPREYFVVKDRDAYEAQDANSQEEDDRRVPRSDTPHGLESDWGSWLGGIVGGRSSRSLEGGRS